MKLNFETTPVFTENWHSSKKIIINRGGTRSSKTVSLCQLVILWLLQGKTGSNEPINKSGKFTIVRKYQATLEKTIIVDFENILNQYNLWPYIEHNKTEKRYKLKGINRTVQFMGADDQQKLRGYSSTHLYCNEVNELNYKQEYFQLLIRTEGRVYMDFNPDDEQIWINTELEQKRLFEKGDVQVIVSTYKDNTFLPRTQIDEIEWLQETDVLFWKIYGLGEYGKVYGLIFDNWKVIESVPKDALFLGTGLDFGFTNDPTAAIELYKYDKELILHEVIYSKGLLNSDIADILKGQPQRKIVIADSSEPKSIKELSLLGISVSGCSKGVDSIRHGINCMKEYHINVTSSSGNLLKEAKTYKWHTDINGNTISPNRPVDYNNHAMDAARYIINHIYNNKNAGQYSVG